MPTELTNIQLKFNCTANWDEMQQLSDCRFCSHCQKKVYNFTGSTREEYEQVLAENNNRVCGRFTAEQAVAPIRVKPFWMKWASAAVMVLGLIIISCKQKIQNVITANNDTSSAEHKKDKEFFMGEPMLKSSRGINNSTELVDSIESAPSFPGGIKALYNYLEKTIPHFDNIPNGRVITQFVVQSSGKIINVKILRGLTPQADKAVINSLMKSPKWIPATRNGKPISTTYTVPVEFK